MNVPTITAIVTEKVTSSKFGKGLKNSEKHWCHQFRKLSKGDGNAEAF
jgi:hypothetical protein